MSKSQEPSVRWVSAFETGTDYEADLVRDRLDDASIPAVVFTQKDHAFNLTVGHLAPVHVMVPSDRLNEALDLLAEEPLSDAELDEAARVADPQAPDAHPEDVDSLLDSSIERIRFVTDDEDPDEEDLA